LIKNTDYKEVIFYVILIGTSLQISLMGYV